MRFLTGLILLLTSPFLYAQPAFISRLDSFFHHQPADSPGFVLSIEKNGRPLYRNATHPLDSTTNFRMASVTKQFTAMGILLLEKAGVLHIDDPIGHWLPELPTRVGNQVHIRHLLTHSSGILDYEDLIPTSQTTQVLDADVLRLLSTHDSTLFPPGSRFRYSNSGFCLLALIIERASHKSYPEYIRDNIFLPLHMDSSTVYVPGARIPRRAMGYPNDQSITSATKGDGGVYTSLNDYAKWTRALQHNTLINLSAAIKKLRFPITGNPGSYYAAGWFLTPGPPLILFHSGGTSGFTNFVVQLPGDGLSIAFFSNLADNSAPFRIIVNILKDSNFADLTPIFHLHDLTR
ncbi:serine hydrolase domain-containing protein [Puia dinghuensis]|nr:serine hydrolase domain-containing protein [Puia dinghuensis]